MHTRLLRVSAILLTVLAAAAWAADVTGTWTGQMSSADGNTFDLTYVFKQEGTKLTGTVTPPQGDVLPLTEGKVEGDKISFAVNVDMGGGNVKFTSTGTIKGDEITLSTENDAGMDIGGSMTLKRQK